MKCLCRLETIVKVHNKDCPVHPLPPGVYVTEYTAEQMSIRNCTCPTKQLSGPGSPLVITGIRSDCPQHGVTGNDAQYLYMEHEFRVENKLFSRGHQGRWRCPVCGQWVDKNAGWMCLTEEEVCGRCYNLIKEDWLAYLRCGEKNILPRWFTPEPRS